MSQDKKETSYTYWVQKDDNFFNGIEVNTKPIKIENAENQQKDKGNSAWNTANTWEEKKIKLEKL